MLQVQITFSLHRGDKLLRNVRNYGFLKKYNHMIKKEQRKILKIDCFVLVKDFGILDIKVKNSICKVFFRYTIKYNKKLRGIFLVLVVGILPLRCTVPGDGLQVLDWSWYGSLSSSESLLNWAVRSIVLQSNVSSDPYDDSGIVSSFEFTSSSDSGAVMMGEASGARASMCARSSTTVEALESSVSPVSIASSS